MIRGVHYVPTNIIARDSRAPAASGYGLMYHYPQGLKPCRCAVDTAVRGPFNECMQRVEGDP